MDTFKVLLENNGKEPVTIDTKVTDNLKEAVLKLAENQDSQARNMNSYADGMNKLVELCKEVERKHLEIMKDTRDKQNEMIEQVNLLIKRALIERNIVEVLLSGMSELLERVQILELDK
jgi:type II secretory pathway predicted ATPase ExeA